MLLASVHFSDIGAWFSEAWPWAWPSVLLVIWVVVVRFVVRRWRAWISARGRGDVGKQLRLSPGVLKGIERTAALGLLGLGAYGWTQLAPVPPAVRLWASQYAEPWILATVVVLAILLVALYGARRLLLWLETRAASSSGTFDDIMVDALSRPLYVTVVLLAVNLWASMLPLPETIQRYVARAGETTIVILVVLFVDGLIQSWMLAREEESKVLKTSGVVLRTAARILTYAIGGLMALSSLGLNVTPALATLGIGSAALGFALQGTVTDFLAGLMIATDQPIRVGDFIILDPDTDHAGWVLAIGWRTTRLLTRSDMEVIVPNSKLAAARFLNTSRPREDCRFQVSVFTAIADDLDRIVIVATGVAEELQREDPRAVHDYRAFAFAQDLHHGHAEVRVWLAAKNWDAHFALKDIFLRRLTRRFRESGIVLPVPMRTLDFRPDTALPVADAASMPARLGKARAPSRVLPDAPTPPESAPPTPPSKES